MKEDLTNKFKLPNYLKGKSFAEASKIIDNKFTGRNDIISKNTKNELLQRLTNAQEYLKSKEQPVVPNQFAEGGNMTNYLSAGMGVLDLATDTFGPTGIDTSGLQPGQKVDTGANVLSGVGKGASLGASIGSVIPGVGTAIGAGAGAIIGAGAGLFKSEQEKKDSVKANKNYANRMHASFNNDWAKGGYMNDRPPYNTNPQSPFIQGVSQIDQLTNDYIKDNPLFLNNNNKLPLNYKSNVKPLDMYSPIDTTITNNSAKKLSSTIDTANQNINTDSIFGDKYNTGSSQPNNSTSQSKTNTFGANALRYAPAISNAMQLMKLQKPTMIRSSRLGNKFKPTYMDERTIRNQLDQELNNSINAITNAAGGSEAASRAGILASGLNRGKALSDSYAKIAEFNAGQNTQGQQIDMQRDIQNLGQERYDTENNLRSSAAYDNNKSMLQSAFANDLGSIGKEELYKKYPEMIGLGYKWDGTYNVWKDNQGNTVDPAKVTNKKKNGGYLNDIVNDINFRYSKKVNK
jgi:hypothetical protein